MMMDVEAMKQALEDSLQEPPTSVESDIASVNEQVLQLSANTEMQEPVEQQLTLLDEVLLEEDDLTETHPIVPQWQTEWIKPDWSYPIQYGIESLQEADDRKLRALELRISPPKAHVFVVEEGKELSAQQRALVKPQDRVVIRMIPDLWLSNC